jgi:hypothetical protein
MGWDVTGREGMARDGMAGSGQTGGRCVPPAMGNRKQVGWSRPGEQPPGSEEPHGLIVLQQLCYPGQYLWSVLKKLPGSDSSWHARIYGGESHSDSVFMGHSRHVL